MIFIFVALLLALGLAYYTFYSRTASENAYPAVPKKNTFFVIAILGLAVRLIAAMLYPGHETDMQCFNGWADLIYKDGFSSFYRSGIFTDYPPGYMYILYVLGFIKNTFNLSPYFSNIILKIPAVFCDILCGYTVFSLCEKKGRDSLKNVLAAFFIFNPAVILNSSIWGQVDSVFTLFVLIMLYLLMDKKTIPAYFVFALAIFIKPQALFYTPVLIFGIIEQVFTDNFSKKTFLTNLFGGLAAIGLIFLLASPFGIDNVITQYKSTLNSYNYVTVNAYNFWCALGLNWADLTPAISFIGTLCIILIVALAAYIFFGKKQENRYFFVSGFICFAVFMLSVRMHERYAFPAMALSLCAAAISASKRDFHIFCGISALQLVNTAHILFYYGNDLYFTKGYTVVMMLTSWASVILLVLLTVYALNGVTMNFKVSSNAEFETLHPITKKDIFLVCVITLIYSVVALYNLGDKSAPKTYETLDNDTIIADFGDEKNIIKIKYYIGADPIDNDDILHFSLLDEEKNVVYTTGVENGSVFTWNEITDINLSGRYLEIASEGTVELFEVGAISDNGEIIPADSSLLIFDESHLVPWEISYQNSTYFDEIYHARTAYEFINELPVYEWTHPPLGKIFISLGIKCFGMTPFGWRICGTLFGILMIPLMYIFSKKMFGMTWISVCASLLFSFDFMHFAQTRIATIDVYVTFFIILMYLLMYAYYSCDIVKLSYKKSFTILGLCGISMGLGIACKWTGVYAGAGLAILFFMAFFRNFGYKIFSDKKPVKTILFSVIAFVIAPLIIYGLSYIPFLKANGSGFDAIIQNQIDMFAYHSDTVVSSTHSFSSPWYMWIINYRPIWYYTGTTSEGLSENISSFGNPFVWIGGLLALCYCIYDSVKNHNRKAQFLVIGYFAQLLPWVFVTRITFIYHYFPCVPFLVLMLAHTASRLYGANSNFKYAVIGFTALAILAFIAFYPVISGFPVDGDYVRNYLRWLPSWQLIG